VEKYQAVVFQKQSPIVSNRILSTGEQIEEFFFLGLRQKVGVDLGKARQLWGKRALLPWQSAIESLLKDGLVSQKRERIYLPESSYLISNEIFQEFLQA
jgi:oxygen-independent coproporphyrinogen-3 oxidase